MCTVTRPGLAGIAAATSVELLVSLIQHPDGYEIHYYPPIRRLIFLRIHAPAPPPNQEIQNMQSYAESGGSVLGQVPHQLRGFLAQFRNLPLVGAAYDRCTGCSETVSYLISLSRCYLAILITPQVLQAYEMDGFEMLLKAFNDQKFLEKLTGLDKLFDEGEAALESVDWDEDDGGDF